LSASDLPRTLLVVGSGGREHALARALASSPTRPRILCAPGNPGIATVAECRPVKADDIDGLVALAKAEHVEFVVVGPEVPLVLGLADRLREAGIAVYGPGAPGARLEASKIYTKQLLRKYGIPTAASEEFDAVAPALAYLAGKPAPIVIKADGLAAGKGVVVAQSPVEAAAAVRDMLEAGRFGAGGKRVLIEDCLVGDETSILVIVSGRDYLILPTSQDHKRIGDGDTGPNTGGMGAYSPAEVVTPALLEEIERTIVRPSVDAIAAEHIEFCGTLFIGIMLTAEGPKVLEYNTRFGDPETQAVLARLETDLLALLWAAACGRLSQMRLKVSPQASICVVVAAQGYPEAYPTGDPIDFPETLPEGVTILHAGTRSDAPGRVVTAGGRVLGITAVAPTLAEAARRAYAVCAALRCRSKYYRSDIGARQLRRR
jgi:phosphoribosylamine---glycine ligase